jgi:uncharacterized protein (DUF1330 family)
MRSRDALLHISFRGGKAEAYPQAIFNSFKGSAERSGSLHGSHGPSQGRSPMRAYYIAEHMITDPGKFEEYRTKVLPMIERYGGRYLTKGGTHRFPEQPHWKPDRAVIIEFPNMDSLNAWYNSAEYQPLVKLRKDSTAVQDMIIILEGV